MTTFWGTRIKIANVKRDYDISYGREWFPYFMRRLAEHPANLVFFLRNMFRT